MVDGVEVDRGVFADGGVPIAVWRDGLMYAISNDHLGRPEAVTSTAGTIVWRARNLAYHREQTVNNSNFGSLGLSFPGQYLDAESGMAYNWHRVYDPSSGRYTQSDPIGMIDGPNLYAYVGSNPVSYVDPTGLGKIGFCIRAGKKTWEFVSKDRARRELADGGDVLVRGSGRSQQARQLAREQFGSRTDRHDGHELSNGKTGMPHYQHANGGRGHVFYGMLSSLTFVGAFGDGYVSQGLDFFNPISDVKDVVDLFGAGEGEESCGCE